MQSLMYVLMCNVQLRYSNRTITLIEHSFNKYTAYIAGCEDFNPTFGVLCNIKICDTFHHIVFYL